MKRKIPLDHNQLKSFILKIQKVWRGYLVRENLKLIRSKQSTLHLKQIKSINNTPCFISVSTKSDRYILRIYEIQKYFEFTLILPILHKYSASYLIDNLDYHPLKLYFINDTNTQSNIWEIVTRTMKRINNKIYIFHFFRKFNSSKLKVNYFEIGDEKEQSTFIYSDLNLENQPMQFIKRSIERRILPKLAIKNNNLEVINRGESQSFDAQFENSLLKIRRLVKST